MIRAGKIVFSENKGLHGIVLRVNEPLCSVFWFPERSVQLEGTYSGSRNMVYTTLPSMVDHNVQIDHLQEMS